MTEIKAIAVGPFSAAVVGMALAVQAKWRIPASLPLAQCFWESSVGKAVPPGSNNWLGIEAVGGRPGTNQPSREQRPDGTWYMKTSGFEIFPSVAACFDRYGQILGLASPYHDAVTAYLKSHGTPDDARTLSKAVAAHWATALQYGVDLVKTQDQYDLYQFNLEPSMTTTTVAPIVATMPVPAPTDKQPPADMSVPTVSQGTTIDWGSWLAQIVAHETPLIESLAQTGEQLALSQIPFGSIVASFIGPKVVKQYVDQALTTLKGVLSSQTLTVPKSNLVVNAVVNMIVSNEPAIAGFLGSSLEPTIEALVAKLKL